MQGLRRSVRKRIRWGCIIVAIQLFLLCLCRVTVKQVTVKKYEVILEEKELLLESAGRIGYVTTEQVRAGEAFTEENVEKRYVLCEQAEDILAVDVIGAVACVDLPSGLILNTSVCGNAEYESSDRMCTYQGVLFSDCFDAYDAVDVRIRYGNGENYCVLRKKRLMPTEKEGGCCFILNEAEQLLMSGAEFDTGVYDGAELYLVGIPNEWEKEELLSMFLPSEQILLQLQELDRSNDIFRDQGPKLRKELEVRLSEHKQKKKDGDF